MKTAKIQIKCVKIGNEEFISKRELANFLRSQSAAFVHAPVTADTLNSIADDLYDPMTPSKP